MPVTKFIAIGDSFTEGRNDPAPGGGYIGWVTRFTDLMSIPRRAVRNLAVFGATTQHAVDHQLPVALAQKSPLASVFVGVNDLLGSWDQARFERNLGHIFDALATQGTTVFTMTYPDLAFIMPVAPAVKDQLRARFAVANAYVHRLVAEMGTFCVDLAAEPRWRERPLWSSDRLHPNADGHEMTAQLLAELVNDVTGANLALQFADAPVSPRVPVLY